MRGALQDRCANGAALAPLSAEDRSYLAALGRLAWEKLGCPGGDYDNWRHARLDLVVERPGLTLCRKEDYGYIKADFLQLLGHKEHAQRWRARAATEPRRVALAKLRIEMAAVLDVIKRPDEYVAAIAKCRFKTANLEELAENQLWSLVYDIRRAAQRRRGLPTNHTKGHERGDWPGRFGRLRMQREIIARERENERAIDDRETAGAQSGFRAAAQDAEVSGADVRACGAGGAGVSGSPAGGRRGGSGADGDGDGWRRGAYDGLAAGAGVAD